MKAIIVGAGRGRRPLLQEMLESGIEMHAVTTEGGSFEIDTTGDWELARRGWPAAP